MGSSDLERDQLRQAAEQLAPGAASQSEATPGLDPPPPPLGADLKATVTFLTGNPALLRQVVATNLARMANPGLLSAQLSPLDGGECDALADAALKIVELYGLLDFNVEDPAVAVWVNAAMVSVMIAVPRLVEYRLHQLARRQAATATAAEPAAPQQEEMRE